MACTTVRLDSGARAQRAQRHFRIRSGRFCDRRSPNAEAASSEAEKGVSVLSMIKVRPPITLSCRVTPCRSTRSDRKPKGEGPSPSPQPAAPGWPPPGFAAGSPTFYTIHICRLYTPSLAPPRSSLNSYREPRVIPTRATRQKAPRSPSNFELSDDRTDQIRTSTTADALLAQLFLLASLLGWASAAVAAELLRPPLTSSPLHSLLRMCCTHHSVPLA